MTPRPEPIALPDAEQLDAICRLKYGEHDQQETVDSVWISPRQALARHAAGEFDLMNVTRIQLESLAGFPGYEAVIAMAEQKTEFPVRRPVVPTGPAQA